MMRHLREGDRLPSHLLTALRHGFAPKAERASTVAASDKDTDHHVR